MERVFVIVKCAVRVMPDGGHKPQIIEVGDEYGIRSETKGGGLRLDFKYKPRYISAKDIDNYVIVTIAGTECMVFSGTYDSLKCIEVYAEKYLNRIVEQIDALEVRRKFWTHYKKKI